MLERFAQSWSYVLPRVIHKDMQTKIHLKLTTPGTPGGYQLQLRSPDGTLAKLGTPANHHGKPPDHSSAGGGPPVAARSCGRTFAASNFSASSSTRFHVASNGGFSRFEKRRGLQRATTNGLR